jgi:hypothetical protein
MLAGQFETRMKRQGIMSMGLAAYTLFHVAISLVGIFSGFVVAYGMLMSRLLHGWTAVFLITTVATSVTGFFFPVHHFMPSHGLGILSLMVLPIAIFALYSRRLVGAWRWVYVVTAIISLYFNFFVLIVQLFEKVPALRALAPKQNEPPFKLTQLVVLVIFFALTVMASIRFHPRPGPGDAPPLDVVNAGQPSNLV